MSEVSADAFDETATETLSAVPEILPPPSLVDIVALPDEQKAEVGHKLQEEITEDSKHVMARYLRIGRNLALLRRINFLVNWDLPALMNGGPSPN